MLDYGLDTNAGFLWKSVGATTASWVSPAGGTDFFEYIEASTPLILDGGFAWVGKPHPPGYRADGGGARRPASCAARHRHRQQPDTDLDLALRRRSGEWSAERAEVLVSSISNATYLLYSQKLAFEFVNFATKSVFAGGRYAYLTAHNDDLFLPNSLWDPAIIATRGRRRRVPHYQRRLQQAI